MRAMIALSFLFFAGSTHALPPQAEAVQKYILKVEYPESFRDEESYRTRIENMLIVDVDGDGTKEVVVHFHPHYRQSPTVAIYRLSKSGKVTRVLEALAPGPLQPVSGNYLDSHSQGAALDIDLGADQNNPVAHDKFLKAGVANFGGFVSYPKFWHVDSRTGRGVYIDMNAVPNPPNATTCDDFEFSNVRQIAFGSLKAETKKYLAAWVNTEVYLYSIRFRADGLLDKNIEVLPLPKTFNGFLPGQGLAFTNEKGGADTLSRPEKFK